MKRAMRGILNKGSESEISIVSLVVNSSKSSSEGSEIFFDMKRDMYF
jgi:hypothetical protein